MTKGKEKEHSLGKKQLQIIRFLAENGSQTINAKTYKCYGNFKFRK